jgi:hypothetical protein
MGGRIDGEVPPVNSWRVQPLLHSESASFLIISLEINTHEVILKSEKYLGIFSQINNNKGDQS